MRAATEVAFIEDLLSTEHETKLFITLTTFTPYCSPVC